MTDGTSQGLFIVVAIVIFGIFVVLAYILFEDTLSPALASMFKESIEKSEDSFLSTVPFTLVKVGGVHERTENSVHFTETTTGGTDGGVQVFPVRIEPNQTYKLSYDIQVLDGNIQTLGGHLHLGSSVKFKVDGVEVPSGGPRVLFVEYLINDRFTHNVEVIFTTDYVYIDENGKYKSKDHSNETIFIQPNRESYETSKFTIKLSNINLKKIN